jgi:hypothetical protein
MTEKTKIILKKPICMGQWEPIEGFEIEPTFFTEKTQSQKGEQNRLKSSCRYSRHRRSDQRFFLFLLKITSIRTLIKKKEFPCTIQYFHYYRIFLKSGIPKNLFVHSFVFVSFCNLVLALMCANIKSKLEV